MGAVSKTKILITAGLISIIAISLFLVLRKTSPKDMRGEPKTVGVLYFRQGNESVAGLKEGLAEMGYTNIIYEDVEFLAGPAMWDEIDKATRKLIEKKVDVIFTSHEHQAIGALKATKEVGDSTPIVFLSRFHDPVKYGLAKSFKSSENNATGVSINLVEVIQKQIEFLREINPAIKNIGVFSEGFMVPPVGDEFLAEFKVQAQRLGLYVVEYKTSAASPPEAEKEWYLTAKKIKQGDIDAIYHIAGHIFDAQEVAEGELAARLRIPHVAPTEDLETGGHFGYADDMYADGKQAALMIDRIFRGYKPSDIPLEFANKNILALHIGRAKKAGIAFPDSMMAIATIKIEE